MQFSRLPVLILLAAIVGIGVGWLLHWQDWKLFGDRVSEEVPQEETAREQLAETAPTLEDMPVADGDYFEESPATLADAPISGWASYRPTLMESFAGEPNFSGKYVLLTIPCTEPSCIIGFIFDAESGDFLAAMTAQSFSFSLDSKLLIATALPTSDTSAKRNFYSMRNGLLTSIGTEHHGRYTTQSDIECNLRATEARNEILDDTQQFVGPCQIWPGYVSVPQL